MLGNKKINQIFLYEISSISYYIMYFKLEQMKYF